MPKVEVYYVDWKPRCLGSIYRIVADELGCDVDDIIQVPRERPGTNNDVLRLTVWVTASPRSTNQHKMAEQIRSRIDKLCAVVGILHKVSVIVDYRDLGLALYDPERDETERK